MKKYNTKKAGKTYTRNNFSSVLSDVKDGNIYLISDRGDAKVAIVPVELLNKTETKKSIPISKSPAKDIFKDRIEMKDSIKYVRKQRESRNQRVINDE